jgi:hypothetical protein
MTELAKQHPDEQLNDSFGETADTFEYSRPSQRSMPRTRHSSDLDSQSRVQLDERPVIEEWLSLTDYSAKYRVSVSTLRRRIKSNQIAHRFVDGRYLLLDSRPAELEHSYHQQETLEPVLNPSSAAEFLRGLGFEKAQSEFNVQSAPPTETAAAKLDELQLPQEPGGQPILSSATRLLNELKRAYMNILHEKEESIIQLKEEVSDLQTLVRVLEEDNARMRRALGLERIPS